MNSPHDNVAGLRGQLVDELATLASSVSGPTRARYVTAASSASLRRPSSSGPAKNASVTAPAQLETLDRVESVAVVPPKLDDRDAILSRQSVHVALWHLPAPGQLLGGQQLWTRDDVQDILYDAVTRLALRETCPPQACRVAVGTDSARESDRGSRLPSGSMGGGTYESGSGILLKIANDISDSKIPQTIMNSRKHRFPVTDCQLIDPTGLATTSTPVGSVWGCGRPRSADYDSRPIWLSHREYEAGWTRRWTRPHTRWHAVMRVRQSSRARLRLFDEQGDVVVASLLIEVASASPRRPPAPKPSRMTMSGRSTTSASKTTKPVSVSPAWLRGGVSRPREPIRRSASIVSA
jgi:hypothetical protein